MKGRKNFVLILLAVFICVIAAIAALGCANGSNGADGKSAYEIWLEEGHTGSTSDFLEWLKGENGKDGADGKSAYEIWLDAGYIGTEADFLNWLRGQTGGGGETSQNSWNVSGNGASSLTASLADSTLTISGNGDMKNFSSAGEVPYNNRGSDIKQIVIGKNVTSIGDYAFSSADVSSVVIPESVESIGSYALPANSTAYVYSGTEISPNQNRGVSFNIYSEGVPESHDRHWTSWGSTGNITDEPFDDETTYWHFDGENKPVVWQKKKVLFIGNSFTFYYQIPKQFAAIAKNLGFYAETYSIAVPSQTLETHAVATSNSGVQITALLNRVTDFNYIVLQEQSTRPYTEYEKFFNAVKALKKKVDDTQDHAEVYLYETWGSPASAGNSYEEIAEMEQSLYEAYTQAAADADCHVSYVGRAFTYVKGETDINLYFGDNRHPGPAGSYLSACVHVATLLGGDVRNVTLTGSELSVISNEGAAPQPMNLSEAQCATLRAAAYHTVFEREEQTQTYTARFWYNDEIQSEKTVTAGFGITLPSCEVTDDDKFMGWTFGNDSTPHAAETRISYSEISEYIDDGVIDFHADTREMIIAVWGRWITEAHFLQLMDGFETYCAENGLDYGKVGYIYYAGKTQSTDPYFLIADFTTQVGKDDADIVFPCATNITNTAQSNIATKVVEYKALGVTLEGSADRQIAKLNGKTLTDAFYDYITTDEAKSIIASFT